MAAEQYRVVTVSPAGVPHKRFPKPTLDAAKREAEDLYRNRLVLEIDHVEIWKIIDDVVNDKPLATYRGARWQWHEP